MGAPQRQNRWAIATVSLGRHPSHTLEQKITAASQNGFQGIELVHADLLAHAAQHDQSPMVSAKQVKELCRATSLEVLSLNPLKNFEGNLATSLQDRLETVKEWISLAVEVGTRHIQVPSQFLEHSTGDETLIISELRALADLAGKSGLSIAYEAVSWARFNPLWQDALRIVEAVGRPNFGLCMDSFHIHSRIWADAYAENGQLPDGPQMLQASMKEFLEKCPKEKIFYVQFSDASKFDPPLTDDSPLFEGLEVKDSRLAWSRNARPFPLEKPGYYPVAEIARTWLVEYGWEGWASMESFLEEAKLEQNTPAVMAARGRESVEKLLVAMGAPSS